MPRDRTRTRGSPPSWRSGHRAGRTPPDRGLPRPSILSSWEAMNDAATAILVHRGRPRRCLDALAALGRQGIDVRPLVVDNGSCASDLEALRAGARDAGILPLGANLG